MEAKKDQKGQEFTTALETYKAQGANMLMPSTHISGLSEFHAPVIETVLLSSDPEQGDVYPHDDAKPGPAKKWRPTKQALMKLSVCAGVIWSPTASNRIDNGADRNYIAYKAVGGIKKADGQPVFFSADYDIDFEVMEEELKALYEKKAQWLKKDDGKRAATAAEKTEYIDYCVKRDMMQKRKFKLRLCEAGAMNRVLRMLLGIKQAYTTTDLAKPFVMARIVFRPDFSDKDVRQQFITASIQNMTGIYGPGALDANIKTAEPIDVTPIPEDEAEKEKPGDNGNDGTVDPIESRIIDFRACEETMQCQAITNTAKLKGYDLNDFLSRKKSDLAKIGAEGRCGLFRHLLSLPDKGTPESSDEQVPY